MKRSVIGLFGRVMNNNVVLCSDWLFLSAAQCWALFWLAVSQCSSMLYSALIGCFTVRLNVELCSDWLFYSAAQCCTLLWLAVSQCGSMLYSALIGCFSVRLNVELCSDWLFHSAAQCCTLLWLAVSQCGLMLSSALIGCFTVRLNVGYLNTFSRSYIIGLLGNIHAGIREPLLKCWALKLLSNARLLYRFTFEIRDRTNSVYTMEKQYLPHIWQDQMLVSGAQDL